MLLAPRFDNPMPPPEPRGERAARKAAQARITAITAPLYAEFEATVLRLLSEHGESALAPKVSKLIAEQQRTIVAAAVDRHWPKFDFEAKERVELASVAARDAEDAEAWDMLLKIADKEIEKVSAHV